MRALMKKLKNDDEKEKKWNKFRKVFDNSEDEETPEEKRKRLREEEKKRKEESKKVTPTADLVKGFKPKEKKKESIIDRLEREFKKEKTTKTTVKAKKQPKAAAGAAPGISEEETLADLEKQMEKLSMSTMPYPKLKKAMIELRRKIEEKKKEKKER